MSEVAPFDGRLCLVTGSSRGIGWAVAQALAAEGAGLILHGRDETLLEEQAARLPGGGHGWIAADLSTGDGLRRLTGQVARQHDKLDVLVHNAGVLGPREKLETYPRADWAEVMQVNLTAPFLITRALLPLLRSGQRPAILFVSSGLGRRGRADWGAYAVSKFGLEGLSQVWADELRPDGIRVNALNPGGTRTAMRAAAFPDEDPLSLPTPEDLAPVFVDLLRPDQEASGQSIDARAHPAFGSGRGS